jgi:FkbM family methyltransferase
MGGPAAWERPMRVWPKAARRWLERRAWRRLDLRWTLSTGSTVEVRSRGDWVLYNDIFVDGEYDEPLAEALAAAPAGFPFTVLDLGANVGFFALRVLHRVRRSATAERPVRIVCVEGNPRAFAELRRRLGATPELDGQVTTAFGLVGAREGRARISDRAFHPMSRIVGERERGAVVDFVDLERLLPTPTAISLLKCDIEGSELRFLRSYPDLLKRVQSAVFELHPGLCDVEECAQLLARAGLRPRKELRRSPSFSLQWFTRS